MMFILIALLLFIFLIIGIVKLLKSENKTKRIWGKALLGILIAPFVILVLLFLTCLVIINWR